MGDSGGVIRRVPGGMQGVVETKEGNQPGLRVPEATGTAGLSGRRPVEGRVGETWRRYVVAGGAPVPRRTYLETPQGKVGSDPRLAGKGPGTPMGGVPPVSD